MRERRPSAPSRFPKGPAPRSRRRLGLALLALALSAVAFPAGAAILTVTSGADSGAGTLRQAVLDASPGDTIDFSPALYLVTLTSEIPIAKNLTIVGLGAAHHRFEGGGTNWLFNISGGVTVSFERLAFRSGSASGQNGGAILTNGATLTVKNSVFYANAATNGGAIANSPGDSLTLVNCSFQSNGGGATSGGALYNQGTATLHNCTMDYGWASSGGAGIYNAASGTLNLANTILNVSQVGSQCVNLGSMPVNTANLISDGSCSPALTGNALVLDHIDGDHRVSALLPGSPALDAGDAAICAGPLVGGLDGRGIARPQGSGCDIGAFESRGFTFTGLSGTPQSATVSTAFATPLGLTVQSAFAEPVDGGKVTFTAPGAGATAVITGSPATIAGGTASVTATANATSGSYAVTPSAAGVAPGPVFNLTNTVSCLGSITVTSSADSGPGSLRQALADICAAGTITFAGSMNIALLATLPVTTACTLDGQSNAVTLNGQNTVRVLDATAPITLRNLAVKVGTASGGGQSGAGLRATAGADIEGCLFWGNRAGQDGGGIDASGTVTIRNSTIAANRADVGSGGGISIRTGSTATINDCTIVDNYTLVSNAPQGIHAEAGSTVTVSNTILFNNQNGECDAIVDGGFNLYGTPAGCAGALATGTSLVGNPLLGSLGFNGGPTETYPLDPKSPAIDNGSDLPGSSEPFDQRGFARPAGQQADIGAFEEQAPPNCGTGWPLPVPGVGLGVFWMFATPCDVGGATVSDTFGDDLPAANYNQNPGWAFWIRNATTNAYEKLLVTSPLGSPGTGYWYTTTLAPTGGVLTVSGIPVAADPAVVPLVDDASGRLNLVGNPFEGYFHWPDVLVHYSLADHTLAQAQADGRMSKTMWIWNGGAYQSFDPSVPGAEGIVRRGEAFWVQVLGAGAIELRIPGPAPALAGPADAAPPLPPPPAIRPERGEWVVRLVASGGGMTDPGNLIGELEGSTDDRDARDLVELPPFSASRFLSVVFPHPAGDEGTDETTTDFRAPGRIGERTWSFEVRSSVRGEPVVLSWDGTGRCFGSVLLVDEGSGGVVPVDGPGRYEFVPDGPVRSFRWIVRETSRESLERPRSEPAR